MTVNDVLREAVADFTEFGYDSPQRLEYWEAKVRAAVIEDSPSQAELDQRMQSAMESVFRQSLSVAATKRRHPDVTRFTIDRIKHTLRPELNRRIMASANLIKINREQMIEKTLQRFSGWATSIPAGGSRVVDKVEVKTKLAKAVRQVKYEERRVAIDQGHKLMASIDAVIATETGAVAMKWRSKWRQPGYDYRPDHKERDGQIYVIRGNWAMEKGLMNKGVGYLDEITQPAEEVFCQCYGVYLLNLRDLPDDMLTAKGRKLLEETRVR